MLDLLLKGGTVLDGTGGPGRVVDVGVRDGLIVSLEPAGSTGESASREVDVTGLMVAPGFVDIHTHYDAQLSWDPSASPSPLHGVTTVIGGNCGFGLAPSGEAHADYLMRLMSRVEGIPLEALQSALSWEWSSFGEWLSGLDGHVGVNAGFLVGHSALRRVAMGERATAERAAEDDVDTMVALLHQALAEGGLGFSTSQAPTHRDGYGQPVPSRSADPSELLALAAATGDHPGTALEFILPGCLNGFTDEEVEFMTEFSLAAGRPANWNVLGVSSLNPIGHLSQLDASTRAAARGARIAALTLPYSMKVRLSFQPGSPLIGLPGWGDVLSLPTDERLRALSDPEVRARLVQGALSPDAGVLRYLADWPRLVILETFDPDQRASVGRSVGELAAERGRDPFDTLADIAIADGLRTGFGLAMAPPSAADWSLRAESWLDPRTVVGGSDAGAHLDMMCGAVYTSSLLESVREHATVSWEEAVHQLTDVPASLYGLKDRGQIAVGYRGDLVVFDPATVAPGIERTVDDLPGGASRLFADATGYEHVFVNGTAVLEAGRLTGATPGTVLRSGVDTYTVGLAGA